ncbi:MAG: 23S rRNA (uracil(1939)-C(5))-methyltransferase RlmD [Clostridia bacterium]|nr:23S rRNA (uracil(1939)-C(5))-methyltransferase RlmD [Clostridia bacterium]
MEIPVKKNEEYIVDIIDNGFEGEGIAKIDNYTIFIDGAIKGEKCKIVITKITSSHAFGRLLELISAAQCRCKPDCNTYKRCGGCNLRHIEYEETLNIKQDKVQNLINKTLANRVQTSKTIGMGNPYNYRNKAVYPIGKDKLENIVFGVYAKRTHEIIPLQECQIQNEESYKIAKFVVEQMKKFGISAYNEKTKQGYVRHIITKVGIQTDEIMVVIVMNAKKMPHELTIANNIIDQFPNVKTVVKNINTQNTNVIMGQKNESIVGRGYITDVLGDFIFKISPMSFYQVNPIQAEALYNIAIENAKITKEDIVCDLYCGIGTIGIFASKFAKKVYGIEIVKQAIEDARTNANLNKINNIDFICGDVEEAFEELIKREKVKPNVVIVDPPRRGLDESTINNILNLKVERVIYISCNPATMVRDLKMMEEKYEIKRIQPVDMFPFTSHVECIAVLTLKDNLQ